MQIELRVEAVTPEARIEDGAVRQWRHVRLVCPDGAGGYVYGFGVDLPEDASIEVGDSVVLEIGV